ncbi:pseudouridine synthase, RluA family [Thioflavicoccus mobilis 8321]|uniref:Pseudouridine synthase n=1 Tax=Thioflavicoccus mobilis 8321 TaxID=765912 RepID=L0H029_9GAMM|nr:23S rRNA pseudouridine(1911/1915/1917) synthase RluD [Thioflavicoccus mobilis]AGA90934.1 pseudouridine synthase, RluA family [Thioflavicoccus mobilis 8321]
MSDDLRRRGLRVGLDQAGRRLDQVLADAFPEFSRSRIQTWINDGRVQVDGAARRCRDKLKAGEEVVLDPIAEPDGKLVAQPIPLRVVFEDDAILVVDKPADLVVHPAAGNPDGTLLNALLHHAPELARLPRAGLVHRLDKDTTGLLVVAKTLTAHRSLVAQLHERTVRREYRALVTGVVVAGGRVDAPIGRHPVQRTRMAVVRDGRPAVSHYRVLERFSGHTLLAVRLETGRTHQIRVHMAHIRHPLVGDPLYGGRVRVPKGTLPQAAAALTAFPRQALHAIALGLTHPVSGAPLHFEVPLAADLAGLLTCLREEPADDASGDGLDRAELAGAARR